MKPRPRNLWRLTVVPLLVLLFSGCLDVSTSLQIDDTGSGVLALTYSIDQRLYELGTFDGPSSEPAVPVSRRDFELLAGSVTGARLRSYSLDTSEAGTATVTAEIEFESLEVINELLGSGGSAIRRTSAGFEWTLFDGAGNADLDEELILSFFDAYRLEFSFSGPSDVQRVDRGEVTRGTARYELPLAEAVLSTEPHIWRIEL